MALQYGIRSGPLVSGGEGISWPWIDEGRTGLVAVDGRDGFRRGAGRSAAAKRRRLPDHHLHRDPAANAVPSKTCFTSESDYGPERTSLRHGVDVSVNARLRGGLTTSIGTSTGRSIVDTCATATKYNQVNATTGIATGPDPRGCHNEDPFQTTVRGLATYIIPKLDVLVSATVRSQPPMLLGATALTSAQWIIPNSVVRTALGHLPVGATATGTTTIQLADNSNRVYADKRRTQIDMRFAKVLRFGRTGPTSASTSTTC